MADFHAKFSHEFEDGPSGPARSYWDFTYGPIPLGTIALHPRVNNGERAAHSILHLLELAFERGHAAKLSEIQKLLGIRN